VGGYFQYYGNDNLTEEEVNKYKKAIKKDQWFDR